MWTPLLKTVPSPWQSGLSCLCPQSQCFPFRSGCLSPLSIALNLRKEFLKFIKLLCTSWWWRLWSLMQICLCCVVWTSRWWSAPVKLLSPSVLETCVPEQLQMQQELQNAPSTNPGWSLSPLKLGKQLLLIQVALEFHVAYIRSTFFLPLWRDLVEPSFYTSIIVSPQPYL